MHEIALILENQKRTNELLRALDLLKEEDSFTGKELADCLTKFKREKMETLIILLKTTGVLITIIPGLSVLDYHFKIDREGLSNFKKQIQTMISIVLETQKTNQIQKESEIKITATMPDVIYRKSSPPRIPSVSSSLSKLITKAETEIWIVNPFFDEFATAYLRDYLIDAVKRGVEIKIITRPSFTNDSQGASIRYLLENLECPHKVEVRTFYIKEKENWYSIHSKIMLIDKKQCYIGSANITEGSFNKNFELGVVITGESVEEIYLIIQAIWKISEKYGGEF